MGNEREFVELAREIKRLEDEIEQIDYRLSVIDRTRNHVQTQRDIKEARVLALLKQYNEQAVTA